MNDGSGEAACRQVAHASTSIVRTPLPPREGREFDVCCSCSFDDQKARLDNLAVELQNDPSANAYIFGYGGRTSRTGEADRLLTRARDYLVNQRAIDASRVIVVNGGFREEDCVEMWIVPRGAAVPQPRPLCNPAMSDRHRKRQRATPTSRRNRPKSQVSSLKSQVSSSGLETFFGVIALCALLEILETSDLRPET